MGDTDVLYLDTSALMKLYVLEDGSSFVQRTIESQDEALPVWEMQEAELMNGLMLKVYRQELTVEDVDQQLSHFKQRKRSGMYVYPDLDRSQLMQEFRTLSGHTPQTGCRTMDILHVACAKVIGAGEFISFDRRQLALAEMAGLAGKGLIRE